MKMIRVWLYKVTSELLVPDCKISDTNQPVTRVIYGNFKYYLIDGDQTTLSCRRKAMELFGKAGHQIKTYNGYPEFMLEQGFRW